jgi:hypothetical protein
MQYRPLTDQATADYAEALRQVEQEISDIDEITMIPPDPRRELAHWHVYHHFRRRRRDAIAERDQLQRIVSHSAPGTAQRHQEARHAAI